ncbi:Response regulator PleD [Rickettsiales bacterium Ac37b]|nr:Response regulator PleD [Rickettsiales bacterium Ac37b]
MNILKPIIEYKKNKMICNFDTHYKFSYAELLYVDISPEVLNLLGYTVEEIILTGLRPLIIKARLIAKDQMIDIDLKELDVAVQNRCKNFEKWEADYLIRRKDESIIWISDVTYPWYDQDNNLIGVIGCLRDITSRVKAETTYKEKLLKQAYTDPLTNLANRRCFFEHLDIEIKGNVRSVSILLIDLDYFKRINDQYGHYVGDQILQGVADKIRSCIRATDIAARLGGEEFGIYLPDTELVKAEEVAQRLRNLINESTFVLQEYNFAINCTVSIGVASTSSISSTTLMDLYKLADKRLYKAKATGRNQVSITDDYTCFIN